MLLATRSITINADAFVNGQTEVSFTEVPQLQAVPGNMPRIRAIQALHDGLLSKFNGLTLCSSSDLTTLTIRLVDRSDEQKFEDVPLTAMLRASNGGFYYEIANIDIDITRSKIILQDGNRTAGEVVALEVIYDYYAN